MNSDPGLHAAVGKAVSASAYDRYIGRWSRLFIPNLLAAAEIAAGHRVLDVATGTGEAAHAAISIVGHAGVVIGADISAAMAGAARSRLPASYRAVVSDGQALAFQDASFDTVLCQLGLMFFSDPTRGLAEFRRVLRGGGCAAVCVISTPDKAPMWGVLAETLSRHLPVRREALHLQFSLADDRHLEAMLSEVGFRDVRIMRETRDGAFGSFDEFWATIEAGIGQLPLTYLALPERERRAVREEVRAGLSSFESNGRLKMSIEMLIGAGRA